MKTYKIYQKRKWIGYLTFLVLVFLFFNSSLSQAIDYGKPGDPIHLNVSHVQPWGSFFPLMVTEAKGLWKKYLPAGSTVNFLRDLQGTISGNAMLAGKRDISYMMETPGIITATKRSIRDIRLAIAVLESKTLCNQILVRSDAPQFKSPDEAIRWLDGKTVATTYGT